MGWWNERRILLWFVPIVLLIIVNGVVAYRSLVLVGANAQQESRTLTVLLSVEAVVSALKDAETGQRGYLLTGDITYLEPYQSSISTVDERITYLRSLLNDNPTQQQHLDHIQSLAHDKIAELRETIELRNTEGGAAALALVLSNRGRDLMDRLRSEIGDVEAEEQRLLTERSAQSTASARIALVNLALSTGFSLLLLVAIGTVVYRDIETRRRTTEELHRQREWFEVTLGSIGDAVIATDTSGAVTFINAPAEALTGWRREDAYGVAANDVFHIINEYTRMSVESPIGEVLRRNIVVGLANHTILIARDGTERAIDDSGAPIRDSRGVIVGVVLVFRDVSARRRVETDQDQLLQLSASLGGSLEQQPILDALIENLVPRSADIGFVDIFNDDGVAQRSAVVAQLPPHRAQLQEWLDRDRPFDGVSLNADAPLLVAHVADETLDQLALDSVHREALGRLGIRSLLVVPLHVHGALVGRLYLVAVHPRRAFDQGDLDLAIEMERRAALALDNSHSFALAQAAVRDREEFLSIAAHELRTPLTALLGRAELLQRRLRSNHSVDEREMKSLQIVIEQSKRLNTMMSTLLDLSRIQLGHFTMDPAPLDLGPLVQRLVSELPVGDRYNIQYAAPTTPLVVQGDALRLEQAVVNLLQNAVKYSPDGGDVRIALFRQDSDAVICVSDDGIGIPATALPNLFGRFYRAANTRTVGISGMGIGLYVVKEIIDLHGGTISATSVEGHGSRFTITLPLIEPLS